MPATLAVYSRGESDVVAPPGACTRTRMQVALATTWALVMRWPSGVTKKPEPRPRSATRTPAGCSSPALATLSDWVTICTTLGPTAAETRSVSPPIRSRSRTLPELAPAPMADAASISHPRLPGNHDLYRCLIGQSSIRKCDAVTKARGWPQVPRGPSGALLLSFKRARLLETLGLGASRSPDGPQCADWPTGGNRAPGATECHPRERGVAAKRRSGRAPPYG